jgi:hypothetical protein
MGQQILHSMNFSIPVTSAHRTKPKSLYRHRLVHRNGRVNCLHWLRVQSSVISSTPLHSSLKIFSPCKGLLPRHRRAVPNQRRAYNLLRSLPICTSCFPQASTAPSTNNLCPKFSPPTPLPIRTKLLTSSQQSRRINVARMSGRPSVFTSQVCTVQSRTSCVPCLTHVVVVISALDDLPPSTSDEDNILNFAFLLPIDPFCIYNMLFDHESLC